MQKRRNKCGKDQKYCKKIKVDLKYPKFNIHLHRKQNSKQKKQYLLNEKNKKLIKNLHRPATPKETIIKNIVLSLNLTRRNTLIAANAKNTSSRP